MRRRRESRGSASPTDRRKPFDRFLATPTDAVLDLGIFRKDLEHATDPEVEFAYDDDRGMAAAPEILRGLDEFGRLHNLGGTRRTVAQVANVDT